MKNYKDLITDSFNNSYRNSTKFEKNFISLFETQRNNFIKKINTNKFIDNKIKKNDFTYKQIKRLYENKYNQSKEKEILIFHKKFETNLKLKKKYNLNHIKLSKTETSVPTYCYLGLLVNQSKVLNKFQKINCILKILDKVSFNEKNMSKCNYLLLSRLILLEKLMIKKITNAS